MTALEVVVLWALALCAPFPVVILALIVQDRVGEWYCRRYGCSE